ncbi:hypothetical protein TSUD_07180 [Trifolium subterraneum]|uniref:DUF1677 domain-containing protein n=1 Tax=Trifolium subterraneum TaxID=3900 RepID=A0A2Z6LNP1_TRISU|nr:hypothetical protein TSUD_07180 [Trifolium subterraneum]
MPMNQRSEYMDEKVVKEAEVVEMEMVSTAKCCCCGLVEECTQAYIARVRERFGGRWICGLCAEAVKEERARSESDEKKITMDEALKRHTKFRQQFRSASDLNKDFIHAVKQILFKTLDSPRNKERFACRPLGRSHSCYSTMETTPPRTTETHTDIGDCMDDGWRGVFLPGLQSLGVGCNFILITSN